MLCKNDLHWLGQVYIYNNWQGITSDGQVYIISEGIYPFNVKLPRQVVIREKLRKTQNEQKASSTWA